ncbi:hypothetical protein MAPG_10191 [Magnaporthiopsis poae ATCC 64411]|uniref:Uncharacterized protein n=1 Tax=Magnaporthiopsis poae (strain ATCC 64411 / 73-15) TaxID=644358 RepID=A0A0C4EBX9_MAGP6|nr:hypothetical protein MAPG_10191 [Magnaporthiopsis poae ATCC 64411]
MSSAEDLPFDPAVVEYGRQIAQRTESALGARDKPFPDLAGLGFFTNIYLRKEVVKWRLGQHPLEDLPTTQGLRPGTKWDVTTTHFGEYHVLGATHDPDGGNLIVNQMHSSRFSRLREAVRMSDLIAFTWAQARGHEGQLPRKPLKLVVMEDILRYPQVSSRGLRLCTTDAMDLVFDTVPGVYGLAPCPRTERLMLRHDAAPGGLEREAFNFMSAQPHVARTHMLLADYPQLFRYHRIDKIHLMHIDYPHPAASSVYAASWGMNIALELGPMQDGIAPSLCVSETLLTLPQGATVAVPAAEWAPSLEGHAFAEWDEDVYD